MTAPTHQAPGRGRSPRPAPGDRTGGGRRLPEPGPQAPGGLRPGARRRAANLCVSPRVGGQEGRRRPHPPGERSHDGGNGLGGLHPGILSGGTGPAVPRCKRTECGTRSRADRGLRSAPRTYFSPIRLRSALSDLEDTAVLVGEVRRRSVAAETDGQCRPEAQPRHPSAEVEGNDHNRPTQPHCS